MPRDVHRTNLYLPNQYTTFKTDHRYRFIDPVITNRIKKLLFLHHDGDLNS